MIYQKNLRFIVRVYYFLTINSLNVNDALSTYIEPNISDFNFYNFPQNQIQQVKPKSL